MKSATGSYKHLHKQKGVALLELTLTIPVLLVMLLLTAEFSRALYQNNTLTKLVRDGSRFMSSHALNTTSQLELSAESVQLAKNLVVSGYPQGGAPLLEGLTTDDVTITVNQMGSDGSARYYIVVSANYRYLPLFAPIDDMGFLSGDTATDFTLSVKSTMRAL